ncbi:MAG: DNA polymerase III subunit delta [Firmicutes bacterium]|nr:DNA polymerase III subunit delta [Bacillota bacterium]
MYRKAAVKHSFKVFSENLKTGNIEKVILMHGVEQYLVKWAVETLVKKYVNPAVKSMDYQLLDDDASCSQVIEAAETFTMFSERRVVWVRDFKPLSGDSPRGYSKDEIKELADYLQNSNDSTILIFSAEEIKASAVLTSALKKLGQVYDFAPIDKPDLVSFARKRFQAAGIDITPGGVNALIDATGYYHKESDYRLFHFANDIQKIIAHSDGIRVTEKDIMETVSGDMDTFVFDMLDGISNNQKEKAFSILYNMLHGGSDAFSIIGAIVSQFEMMLSVKQMREEGLDLGAIHKKLGGSEFRIKKMLPYANRYSVEKLKSILSSIYEVDRNIKTGVLEPQLALEMFIAGI